MALSLGVPPGATPIDPDEAAGIIPKHIATRGDLDEYESANVAIALAWAAGKRREVLEVGFLRELHRSMFGKVWRWAGEYRRTEKNIGIAPHDIAAALADLVADIRTQLDAGQAGHDEIAVRFHHRLTKIHAFANGNGRHARLATDLLLEQLGESRFEWGAALERSGEARDRYIAALRAADARDYQPLLDFLEPRRSVGPGEDPGGKVDGGNGTS